jgi:hypothetical protein
VSALVALIHMAAKGRRAAVANRFKRLFLVGADNTAPLLEEIVFVSAEDVRHLGLMFAHDYRETAPAG